MRLKVDRGGHFDDHLTDYLRITRELNGHRLAAEYSVLVSDRSYG